MNHQAIPKAIAHLSSATARGRTTIPAVIRREAGIGRGDKLRFAMEKGRIVVEKADLADVEWNAGQSAMMSEWDDPDDDAYND